MNTENTKKLLSAVAALEQAMRETLDAWSTEMANLSGKIGHMLEETRKVVTEVTRDIDEQSAT